MWHARGRKNELAVLIGKPEGKRQFERQATV
jgi:hypothetical protein